MRPLWACALAASCGAGSALGPGGGPLQFTIAGVAFQASSGAASVPSGVLTFDITDQPDTCTALRNSRTGNPPIGIYTRFELRVAPGSDGSARATVVPPGAAPAAGQAMGGLARMQGGQKTDSIDAADGTVQWTLDGSGNATLVSVDVGFAGTSDRLAAGGLYLPACTP